MLPSNRETGCLSDTWIKMDALYFPPCSVREQGGETERGGVKREGGERMETCRGHEGRYTEGGGVSGRTTKGQYTV